MAVATVLSRAQSGMQAPLVRVEVDVGSGLPTLTIVGLPEAVVKESKDRVRAAILNSNFEVPAGRITVNLAPADLPKEGGRFDLPIALGILIASEQLKAADIAACEFYGELSLSGELRPVRAALPATIAATAAGHRVLVPPADAAEARVVSGARVASAAHLLEVCAHLSGAQLLEFGTIETPQATIGHHVLDLADVRGQQQAKRALEIAAAGGHSILLVGPPGSGKSMLAQRLPGLLPMLSEAEAIESAAVRSVAGIALDAERWRARPFRHPHHTASAVALVGGGSRPRPGEISLAHNGVLFMDELPEFDRRVLEVLREPLESGSITISRAARQAEFPARFQLIAAMNPCPCGYLGDPAQRCRCRADQVERYRGRISGPLLDRLDIHVEVPRVETRTLLETNEIRESSAQVAVRVSRAREVQYGRQGMCNARLDNSAVGRYCMPDSAGGLLLDRAAQKLGLSARAYHRVLKLARTIADLAGSRSVLAVHVSEAIGLRKLDRRSLRGEPA